MVYIGVMMSLFVRVSERISALYIAISMPIPSV